MPRSRNPGKCLYGVLSTYLCRNPGWHLRWHEVLSGDPVDGMRGLYEALGLEWTARVQTGVVEHTRSGNPAAAPRDTVHQLRRDSAASVSQWKNILTEREVALVLETTSPVLSFYYPDGDRSGPSLEQLAAW